MDIRLVDPLLLDFLLCGLKKNAKVSASMSFKFFSLILDISPSAGVSQRLIFSSILATFQSLF